MTTMTLLLATDTVGGVWTYALDLARGLVPHGVRTVLAVLGPDASAAQRGEAATIPGARLVSTGLPLDWTARDPAEVAAASAILASYASIEAVDVAQVNSAAYGCAPFSVPLVVACHSCVATWWAAMRPGVPLPSPFAGLTDLARRGLSRAAAVVAPTRAFAAATSAAYGLARAPNVVWNGRAAAGRPLPSRSRFVMTTGRLWDEAKNVAALDAVAATLPAPILAAGPLVGENGAATRLEAIEAVGRLDAAAVRRWLACRPVYASMARYEPFGLGVLEAAQAGCPLVLADIPTFRELWDGAAAFVALDDADALAAALTRALDDAAWNEGLAQAARERSARYGLEAMAAGMAATYRTVAGRGAAA